MVLANHEPDMLVPDFAEFRYSVVRTVDATRREVKALPESDALVLAGGGIAGIAWHTGFLYGLTDTPAGAGLIDQILAADPAQGRRSADWLASWWLTEES